MPVLVKMTVESKIVNAYACGIMHFFRVPRMRPWSRRRRDTAGGFSSGEGKTVIKVRATIQEVAGLIYVMMVIEFAQHDSFCLISIGGSCGPVCT